MLTPHVKPGVTTDAARQARARLHRQRAGRDSGAAELRAARLHAVPEVDLHVGQPRRSATASRTTRPLKNGDIVNIDVTVIKDGWHGDTSRMFIVGEGSIAAQAPVPDHLRGDVEGHRQGQARARTSATSATRSRRFAEKQRLLGRARVLRPRHRHALPRGAAGAALRPPGHARRAEAGHDLHDRADDQRRQARHPRGRRRLDHRHARPLAVGAVGAHGARHRDRLRGADRLGRNARRRPPFVSRCRRARDAQRSASTASRPPD